MRRRLAGLLLAVGVGTGAVTACHLGPVVAPVFCSATNLAGPDSVTLSPGQGVSFDEPGPCVGITRPSPSTFALPTAGTYKVTFKGDTEPTTQPSAFALELNDVLTTVDAQTQADGSPVVATGSIVATAGSTLRVVNSGTETIELSTGRSASITVRRIG